MMNFFDFLGGLNLFNLPSEETLLSFWQKSREETAKLIEASVQSGDVAILYPIVQNLLESEQAEVIAVAIEMLSVIGTTRAMEILKGKLATSNKGVYVTTRKSLQARFQERRTLDMRPLLELIDAEADNIAYAIELFVVTQAQVAIPKLITLIKDRTLPVTVRESAARALANIPGITQEQALNLGEWILWSRDPVMEPAIISVIASSEQATDSFIFEYLTQQSLSCSTRIALIKALGNFNNVMVIRKLVLMYENEAEFDVRCAALEALVKIASREDCAAPTLKLTSIMAEAKTSRFEKIRRIVEGYPV